MAKTNAERSREYRARIRASKSPKAPKAVPKSALERMREWRERMKKLKEQGNQQWTMKIINKKMSDSVPIGAFNAALWKRYQEGKIRNVYPLSKYNDIVQKIKTIDENPPINMPGEYYLLRKFIVVTVAGKERLSNKPENGSTTVRTIGYEPKFKFYVALEEIYKYIDEAHKGTKHGGRDRIVRIIHNQGIVNITRDTVELFLSFCKVCRPRRKDTARVKDSSPIHLQNGSCDSPDSINNEAENVDIPTPLNNAVVTDSIKVELGAHTICDNVCSFTRGYIDLLDFSQNPDGDYRFIFVYVDIQTCFCILYPVRCKCTHELVSHLVNVFTLIGQPQVLHNNFSEDFSLSIIRELKVIWPKSIIVTGSKNYSEVQIVAEKCVCELYEMLRAWMVENNSSRWSFGLKFTQLRKNTKFIGDNTKTPYECFFGRSFKGLNLPANIETSVLTQAYNEDDLLKLIADQKNAECENLQVSLDPNICSLVQNNGQQHDLSTESDTGYHIHSSMTVYPDEGTTETNEMSDYSSDVSNSPNIIVIKKEIEES